MTTKQSTKPEPKKIPGFIVYAGAREGVNGAIVYVFYGFTDPEVNKENTDESTLRKWIFDKPLFRAPTVGSVYECNFIEDSVTFVKGGHPVAAWKNRDARTKWQALETAMNTFKSLMKEVKDNTLIERLQPIKEAYREAGTQNRRNILSEVIRIITT
jgi:hypothetical protein